MPTKKPVTVTVIEAFAAESVDAAAHVVRGVKVLGFESANGRIYPPAVVKAAVGIYEGRQVNVDHGPKPGAPRRVADRFGNIKNVRFVEGSGLHADLYYNPKHKLAEQIAWAAEHDKGSMGFSHDALLRFADKQQRGRDVVEEIVSAKSVDLVADPATTRGFFEEESYMDPATDPTPAAGADPVEALLESIASKITAIVKGKDDSKTKMRAIADLLKKQDKLMALLDDGEETPPADPVAQEQIRQLTAKLQTFEQKEAAAARLTAISEELAAAGLDRTNTLHVSEMFSTMLLKCESKDDRAALIKDRAALVGVSRPLPKPVTPTSTPAYEHAGGGGGGGGDNWLERLTG